MATFLPTQPQVPDPNFEWNWWWFGLWWANDYLDHITIHDSSFGSEPAIGIKILGFVAKDGGLVVEDVRRINSTSKTEEKG